MKIISDSDSEDERSHIHMNLWNKFLHENAGKGYSIQELASAYRKKTKNMKDKKRKDKRNKVEDGGKDNKKKRKSKAPKKSDNHFSHNDNYDCQPVEDALETLQKKYNDLMQKHNVTKRDLEMCRSLAEELDVYYSDGDKKQERNTNTY